MFKNLLSIEGRIGRLEFLAINVAIGLVMTIVAVLPSWLVPFVNCVLTVFIVAASIRRFQDFNFTRWAAGAYYLSGLVGVVTGVLSLHSLKDESHLTGGVLAVICMIAMVTNFVLMAFQFFRKGSNGENSYGLSDSGSAAARA